MTHLLDPDLNPQALTESLNVYPQLKEHLAYLANALSLPAPHCFETQWCDRSDAPYALGFYVLDSGLHFTLTVSVTRQHLIALLVTHITVSEYAEKTDTEPPTLNLESLGAIQVRGAICSESFRTLCAYTESGSPRTMVAPFRALIARGEALSA